MNCIFRMSPKSWKHYVELGIQASQAPPGCSQHWAQSHTVQLSGIISLGLLAESLSTMQGLRSVNPLSQFKIR